MTLGNRFWNAGRAIWLVSASFLLPVTLASTAAAQDHPVMSNVVPDGGVGAIDGTIAALDMSSRKLTVASPSGQQMTFNVADSVNTGEMKVGDKVEVEYSRTVFWLVNGLGTAVPEGATHTVGEVAHTPGGIGIDATQVSGRVIKVDADKGFDIVNHDGGGVYSIEVSNPNKLALVRNLHVGDAITIMISELTANSVVVVKCGWFGCS